MEVIIPVGTALASSGVPAYIYSAWAAGTNYTLGAVVRYNPGSGLRNYRCLIPHLSATSNAPDKQARPPHWMTRVGFDAQAYWEDLGSSTATGRTYTTNVRTSAYQTWTSGDLGTAILERETFWDPATQHDYLAVVAISAGDNTLRPSEAAASADADVAARWLDLGPGNAFACLDGQVATVTQGLDSSGTTSTIAFTIELDCSASDIDRLCFAGINNCESVSVTVTDDGVTGTPVTASLAMSGATTYGRYRRTANLTIPTVAKGSTASVAITLTRISGSTALAQVGLVTAGKALVLADTEWGVSVKLLSFSKKQRDETFGTLSFLRRQSARAIQATCAYNPATISGDVLHQLIGEIDGIPCFFDFNAADTSYDRLRVFGFTTSADTPIPGLSWGSLVLSIEGLVE